MPVVQPPSHAVVIGGSVAGLCAARVLTDHFERVTVLEKDALRDDASMRRGVPQARHVHALLIGGQRIVEGMFPGFTAWMVANGAETPNIGLDGAWYVFGAFRPKYRSELSPISATRPLIEQGIRRFALKNSRLTLITGADTVGLLADADRARVTGVRYADADGVEHSLEASLVVDASGRGSRLPAMLEALGLPAPEETTVTSRAGYATRVLRLRRNPSWKLCYVQPSAPGGTRGGIIAAIEGDRAIVTLLGMAGDVPPGTEAGLQAFAESLPTPEIADALRDAEPLSPIYTFARAENRMRHYERLPRTLDGLVALGDAVFALNPVYGQGMSVAAIGARTLGEVLASRRGRGGLTLEGVSRQFQAALHKTLALPWQMATGEDLRWGLPENKGHIGLANRVLNAYVDMVQRASLASPYLCEAFYRVAQMLDAPPALFRPGVIARTLWHALTDQRGPKSRVSEKPKLSALEVASPREKIA